MLLVLVFSYNFSFSPDIPESSNPSPAGNKHFLLRYTLHLPEVPGTIDAGIYTEAVLEKDIIFLKSTYIRFLLHFGHDVLLLPFAGNTLYEMAFWEYTSGLP